MNAETMSIKDLVVQLEDMRSNAVKLAAILDRMANDDARVARELNDDVMAAGALARSSSFFMVAQWIREDILGEGKE